MKTALEKFEEMKTEILDMYSKLTKLHPYTAIPIIFDRNFRNSINKLSLDIKENKDFSRMTNIKFYFNKLNELEKDSNICANDKDNNKNLSFELDIFECSIKKWHIQYEIYKDQYRNEQE